MHNFKIGSKFVKEFLNLNLYFGSSRKYYYYRRPIRDPSETDMPDWRPIGDLDMLHWRLACPIGNRHAPSETDMPDRRPTWLRGLIGILTHYIFLIFIYFLLIYIYWNNVRL